MAKVRSTSRKNSGEVANVSVTATQKKQLLAKMKLLSDLYSTKSKLAKTNYNLARAGLISQDMICW